jgi:hypothetical protein
MTLPYVFVAVAVPLALMGATLIMERLEHRVLGLPARTDEERCDAALPAAHQPPTTGRLRQPEDEIVADPATAA